MEFFIDWHFVTDADVNGGSSVCLELMWLRAFGKKTPRICRSVLKYLRCSLTDRFIKFRNMRWMVCIASTVRLKMHLVFW